MMNKNKRWLKAQRAERTGWKSESIRLLELKEIEKKYKDLLADVSKRIHFQRKWRILDLGCGPTCISRFLPPAHKFGIDPLAAKLGVEGKNIGGVKVLTGKGESLPYGNKIFNLIICRNVIDHVENPVLVVSEAKRVLVDDGYFVIACYVYSKPIMTAKKISEKIPFLRNTEHPFTFTIDSLEKLIKNDFIIYEKQIIYTGYNPNDYGKIEEKKSKWTFLQRLMIFMNFEVFNEKWFLKEYCLICKKRK